MNEINNINEFDSLFKEGLENTIATPPNGLWENMSTQIGSNAAKTIGKTALTKSSSILIKTLTTIAIASVASVIVYQITDRSNTPKNDFSQLNETTSITTIDNNDLNEEININKLEIAEAQTTTSKTKTFKQKVFKEVKMNDKMLEVENPETNLTDRKPIEFKLNDVINTEKNETSYESFNNKEIFNDTNKVEDHYESEDIENTSIALNKDSIYKFFPNVVTPNSDGYNDVYLVKIKGETYFHISIFNEKMERLFESKNKNIAWDCRLPNGDEAPSGNYFVVIKYQLKNDIKKTETIKLELLR